MVTEFGFYPIEGVFFHLSSIFVFDLKTKMYTLQFFIFKF